MENHTEEIRQLETTGEACGYFSSDIVVAYSTTVRIETTRSVQSNFENIPKTLKWGNSFDMSLMPNL